MSHIVEPRHFNALCPYLKYTSLILYMFMSLCNNDRSQGSSVSIVTGLHARQPVLHKRYHYNQFNMILCCF